MGKGFGGKTRRLTAQSQTLPEDGRTRSCPPPPALNYATNTEYQPTASRRMGLFARSARTMTSGPSFSTHGRPRRSAVGKIPKMNSIKKKMDNEDSRRFWDSFPRPETDEKQISLPSIGEAWWEAEKELSTSLLSLKEPI
jgi:hypothetical protein